MTKEVFENLEPAISRPAPRIIVELREGDKK